MLVVLAACGRVAFDGVDAPSADAPSADAPSADAPSGGCPAFSLFCDDFESGDFSRWTFTDVDAPAVLVVANTTPFQGAFVLDANSPPNAVSLQASANYHFAVRSTGVLAGRFYFQLQTPLANYSSMIGFYDGDDDYVAIGGDEDANWVASEESTAGGLMDLRTTIATPPTGSWNCAELVYTFAPAQLQLFVNGTAVIDVPSTVSGASFLRMLIGITRADAVGFHVLIDDVVLADQRIGC